MHVDEYWQIVNQGEGSRGPFPITDLADMVLAAAAADETEGSDLFANGTSPEELMSRWHNR